MSTFAHLARKFSSCFSTSAAAGSVSKTKYVSWNMNPSGERGLPNPTGRFWSRACLR